MRGPASRRRTPSPTPRSPADPYPGAVPPWSFVHLDGLVRPITPGPRIDGTDLDGWLADRGAEPLARRVPLLTYGSNRCPGKIGWLRRTLGLAGPVVVLRARTEDVAAVWAHGLRTRDGRRPAVLAAVPGAREEHAVWMADTAQVAVLDRCEGRHGDGRYRLARVHTGAVHLDDGSRVEDPWCYVGNTPVRRPLLLDGDPVRCVDVPQAAARDLCGEPAAEDGLDAATVDGGPNPDEWPATLFAYGLLQPGQPSWPLVTPHAAGEARRARVVGTVYDTGRGYPALRPGTGTAPGWAVPLRDPATLLPTLDAYEGPGYRRVRLRTRAGAVCWAYAWRGPVAGMQRLPGGWRR